MSQRPAWWLPVLAKIWPITWMSAKATTWPVVGGLIARLTLPLFSGRNFNVSYIPINETLTPPGSTPLPVAVVEELIRRSAHRVIINKCTCRDARQCDAHPVGMGCTLLGEGAREIDERIARHVSVDEAIDHLHATLRDGLIPMTGRVKIDNFIWGVRDRGKLLTICHCCRCCCTILNSGKYFPATASASLVPLKGVGISVDRSLCTRCGTCVTECFMGAISMSGGFPAHDTALCKACGRCDAVCPSGATRISINDVNAAIDEIVGRIRERINFE
ncbi:MAG TPA: 4Fe-4S binding protein [Spirochaetota bacterium]|nr:4Fe-4S binding protein [Spirochaetota bacterium]